MTEFLPANFVPRFWLQVGADLIGLACFLNDRGFIVFLREASS